MKNKNGFTLIELLAVVVVVAILLAIVIPTVMKTIENQRKKALLISIKSLARAIKQDSIDNDGEKYVLDETGNLYRINDNSNIKLDYKGKLTSKQVTTIVPDNSGSINLLDGSICDKDKKYCIYSDCNHINLESQADNVVSKYEKSIIGNHVLLEGNITKNATFGSVTYKYCDTGKLIISGTGDGIMKNATASGYNSLDGGFFYEQYKYFYKQLGKGENFPLEQIHNVMFLFYINNFSYNDIVSFIKLFNKDDTIEEIKAQTGGILDFVFGENGISVYENLNIKLPKVNEVIINEGVTTVGDFYFTNLADGFPTYYSINNILLPKSIKKIGRSAFYNNQISLLELPNNLEVIENYAFAKTQLTNITIPASVTSIGDWAFGSIGMKLSDITILGDPSRFNNIGNWFGH